MSTIFIGMDDTDNLTSPGTGHLARDIAAILCERFHIIGVTRHQLLFDVRVPMTAKNSANVIHLCRTEDLPSLDSLADDVAELMQDCFQPGSDPGLCVAEGSALPPAIVEFGQRTKTSLVTAAEAQQLANTYQIILRPLGGDGGGVIGALAAAGLASSGNDGRFNQVGRIRELRGVLPVETIRAAGAARVQSIEGQVIQAGLVDTGERMRLALRDGQPVLLVEAVNGRWRAVRRD